MGKEVLYRNKYMYLYIDTYMGMLIYMYHRLPGEHSIHQTEINSRKIATLFKFFYISRD